MQGYIIYFTMRLHEQGVTLVELSVVIFITMTLLGLITINLLNARSNASVTSSINSLIANVKSQQTKSMIRDTGGRNFNSAYGAHFETNSYTLYYDTYTLGYQPNFVTPLDANFEFVTTFPNSRIQFASGSGQIMNFTPGSNTVTLRSTVNSEQKVIQFNRFGVVTDIN